MSEWNLVGFVQQSKRIVIYFVHFKNNTNFCSFEEYMYRHILYNKTSNTKPNNRNIVGVQIDFFL